MKKFFGGLLTGIGFAGMISTIFSGVVLLGLVVFTIKAAWMSFVLMKLWNWLVLPNFDVIELTYTLASIIIFMYMYLLSDFYPEKSKPIATFAGSFISPAFFLGMGWFLKEFVL